MRARPIRVLELRSVRGTGGGPEKTILFGAAQADPARYRVTVCYVRDARDTVFGIDVRAAGLPVDYAEVRERHSFDPSIWLALRRLVEERHIDIVHAHDYKTDLIAWLLYRLTGMRVLSTAHGWSGSTRRERVLYYPADKYLLARLPRVIAVSSRVREHLLAWGAEPDRVTVVLNGVDDRVFTRERRRERDVRAAFGLVPSEFVIGAVGRLESEKRFDLLLDAFARVSCHHPHLRLLVAGDGSMRTGLEAQASRLGLGERVRMLGHIDDVVRFHHALDLLVQSSDTEGTPNAVLEAMALETPVVATDVGGTGDLLTDGVHGLLVPAGSSDELAAAVQRTIADPVAARARSAAARTRVEHRLSFKARMMAVEVIYDELMAAPARREAA